MERLNAFAEVVGLAEPAVALSLEFDGGFEIGVLGRVEERLRVRCASGENARNSSTSASVAASSLSSGTHSVAMPQS